MNKNFLSKIYVLMGISLSGLLVSCNIVLPTVPGAEQVMITNQRPLSNDCTFIDPVYITYIDVDHCPWSNINSLKNQAYGLGANLIVLTPPLTEEHIMSGYAYYCGPVENEPDVYYSPSPAIYNK